MYSYSHAVEPSKYKQTYGSNYLRIKLLRSTFPFSKANMTQISTFYFKERKAILCSTCILAVTRLKSSKLMRPSPSRSASFTIRFTMLLTCSGLENNRQSIFDEKCLFKREESSSASRERIHYQSFSFVF